jgi:hypothetical protein
MEEGRRRSSRSKAAVSYAELAGEGAGEGERVREGEAAQMRESTSEEEDSVDEVKRVESAAGKGKAAGKAARNAAGKATRKARYMDEGTSEESEEERPRAKRRPNAGAASGGLPRESARLLLSDALMRGLKPVNPLAAAANAKGVDFWPDEGDDGLVRRVAVPAPAAVSAPAAVLAAAPAPAAVDAAVPVNAAAPPAPTPVAPTEPVGTLFKDSFMRHELENKWGMSKSQAKKVPTDEKLTLPNSNTLLSFVSRAAVRCYPAFPFCSENCF